MDSKAYDHGYKVGLKNGSRFPPVKFQKTHLKFDSWDCGYRDGQRKRSERSKCICTRVCDCQSPDTNPAGCSNECPEHNSIQMPSDECEASQHWFQKALK